VVKLTDLLENFLALESGSDTAICKFVNRFGGLEAFTLSRTRDDRVEYCDVWRYFARAMTALFRIAARSEASGDASTADWNVIGTAPKLIEDWFKRRESLIHKVLKDPGATPDARMVAMDSYVALSGDPEANWSLYVNFIRRGGDRNRAMLVRLLNGLLQLGQVRPWVLWPKGVGRARLVYSSPRLLSYLALQLCLRIAGLESFVVCHHCRKEYAPPQRAPKANQRNFCPECREAGIPKTYAVKDYRERKRNQ
jgi:hypothetical protein